jgi:ABC-type Na+ efflux pump permease subunit
MNRRNVWIIAKKEFRGLYNEKTIVLAIFLQLFIAMFSSFLVVGLTSMYDPAMLSGYSSIEYAVGYAGAPSGLEGYLDESADFKVYHMELSPAVAALKERKLAAVIYVPETPPDADDAVVITLYMLQNDLQAAVVGVKLKEAFVRFEEDLRAVRSERLSAIPIGLSIPEARGGGEFYEFIFGLLIPLLSFLPAIVAAALAIDLITEEYQFGTLETLMASPVSFAEMIWGKVLACELIVPVQAGAWLLLMMANGIRVQNFLPIVIHVSVLSFILILIAALTALFYRERTEAQFIYSTTLVIVMLVILAIPGNPLNVLTRLAVGTAGPDHWTVLVLVGLAALGLAVATHAVAAMVGRCNLCTP